MNGGAHDVLYSSSFARSGTSAGGAAFPGSVGDIFWGGITGPRYFMDPQQRLVGVLFLQRPSERAAVHAEFRALVYGSLQPTRP